MPTNSEKGQDSGRASDSSGAKPTGRRAAEKDEKAMRLAAALRQNLRRRKAQARSRREQAGHPEAEDRPRGAADEQPGNRDGQDQGSGRPPADG